MKYGILHKTGYHYSEPASLSQNELFLHPRETDSQHVVESRLEIDPAPEYMHRRTDYFGNLAHMFTVQQSHNELTMTVTSMVETSLSVTPTPANTTPWEIVAQRLTTHAGPAELEAIQFVFASPMITVTMNATYPAISTPTPNVSRKKK